MTLVYLDISMQKNASRSIFITMCKMQDQVDKYLNLKPDILVGQWSMPLVPSLGRQRQAVQGQLGLQCEFQYSQIYTEKSYLLVLSSETIVSCTFCILKMNFTLENLNLYYQSRELCIKFFFIDTVLHIENVLHKDICDGFLHFTNCCALWESIQNILKSELAPAVTMAPAVRPTHSLFNNYTEMEHLTIMLFQRLHHKSTRVFLRDSEYIEKLK